MAWGGVFISDWGGTTSTVKSINAGLDLEMPGPPDKRSATALAQPLKDGQIDLSQVDQMASNILRLLQRTAPVNPKNKTEYCRDMDDPKLDTRAFLRRAAAAGIVMLKNTNGALPLQADVSLTRIAVVGPNAKRVGRWRRELVHQGALLDVCFRLHAWPLLISARYRCAIPPRCVGQSLRADCFSLRRARSRH